MSSKAVSWAFEQKVSPATAKLLLLAYAEHANPESRLCFPSIAALEAMTSLNRKTISPAVERLVDLGYLEDTGKRVGHTMQIKVYRFTFAQNETGPKSDRSERGPKSEANRPDFTAEESRNRATEPSIEPSKEELPPSSNEEGTPKGDVDLFGGQMGPAFDPNDEGALPDRVMEAWNGLASEHKGITSIRKLNATQRRRIVTRAKAERIEGETLIDVWQKVFDAIAGDAFLRGEARPGADYDKPFKNYLDYMLRPAIFSRAVSGGYDAKSTGRPSFDGSGRRLGPTEQAVAGAIDRLSSARPF